MIALDLFAALMIADLPNRCMVVLAEAIANCYGPIKHRDVILDPATIEDRTHMHRNNIRRAINELVAAKILRRLDSGAFVLNKDYEAWRPGGQALADRLGGGPIKFAKGMKRRHGKTTKESKCDPIQGDCDASTKSAKDPIQPNPGDANHLNPVGFRWLDLPGSREIGPEVYASDANQSDAEGSGLAHARTREDLRLQENKTLRTPPPPPNPTGRGDDENANAVPSYPTKDGPLMIMGGPYPMDQAEAADIWSLLWRTFGSKDKQKCEDVANGFFIHQAYYPAKCWRFAIQETARARVIPRTVAYLETIAARHMANGAADHGPVEAQADPQPSRRETPSERRIREFRDLAAREQEQREADEHGEG